MTSSAAGARLGFLRTVVATVLSAALFPTGAPLEAQTTLRAADCSQVPSDDGSVVAPPRVLVAPGRRKPPSKLTVQILDPTLARPVSRKLAPGDVTADGRLANRRVRVEVDPCVPRFDAKASEFVANGLQNPWYQPGNTSLDNRRVVPFLPVGSDRGADRLAEATSFYWANRTHEAVRAWSGWDVPWGEDGVLVLHPQAAEVRDSLYDRLSRHVLFGIYAVEVGEEERYVQTATSPHIVMHESGHAIVSGAKPNRDLQDEAFSAHEETVGYLFSLLVQLREPDVVKAILRQAQHPRHSTLLTKIGQSMGEHSGRTALLDLAGGQGVDLPARYDAVKGDGPLYLDLLLKLYDAKVARRMSRESAFTAAANDVGRLLVAWHFDHVGEVRLYSGDLPHGIFKAAERTLDKDQRAMLDGLLRAAWGEPLTKEIEQRYARRNAELPEIGLPERWEAPGELQALLDTHAEELQIPEGFSLRLIDAQRRNDGAVRVRARLHDGTGPDAAPFGNITSLVFVKGQLFDHLPALGGTVTAEQLRAAIKLYDPGEVDEDLPGDRIRYIEEGQRVPYVTTVFTVPARVRPPLHRRSDLYKEAETSKPEATPPAVDKPS